MATLLEKAKLKQTKGGRRRIELTDERIELLLAFIENEIDSVQVAYALDIHPSKVYYLLGTLAIDYLRLKKCHYHQ